MNNKAQKKSERVLFLLERPEATSKPPTVPTTAQPDTNEPPKRPNMLHPASFQADARSRDHLLITGILEQHNKVGLMECKMKCEEFGTKCQSFSISESEKKCFLYNIIRAQAATADYVYKEGYVYYQRMWQRPDQRWK